MENPGMKKELPIEWYIPEDIVGQYANNIVVQHGDNEFIVSFFQTIPPLIIGSPESIKAQINSVEEVRSKCVARIIIAPEKMGRFIEALSTNYKKALSKKGLEEEK